MDSRNSALHSARWNGWSCRCELANAKRSWWKRNRICWNSAAKSIWAPGVTLISFDSLQIKQFVPDPAVEIVTKDHERHDHFTSPGSVTVNLVLIKSDKQSFVREIEFREIARLRSCATLHPFFVVASRILRVKQGIHTKI